MSIPVLMIFIGVLLTGGMIAFALAGSGAQAGLRKRAKTLKEHKAAPQLNTPAMRGTTSVKRTEARSVPLIENLTRRFLPRQTALRDRLMRTGHSISLGTYVLINIGVALVAAIGAIIFTGIPAVAALIGLVAGVGLPHLAVGFLGKRRKTRFIAGLPEAIDLIVRGLKSGLPVTESMAAVGREMQDPIGPEFARITDCVRFGQPLEEALWDTARRLDIPDFNFFVISLSIQRETGGNLAETLNNLSDIIRRRRQMRLKIKAMSSEARASAYILGSLPFIMFALIHVINPGYVSVLFTDPRGMVMLGAGLLSIGMGVGVMAKLIRFEI